MAINHTTDQTFQKDVLEDPGVVLVDFWAEWCGPCQALAPILEELAQAFKGKLKIVKLNIEKDQKTPTKYNIRSIPTLLLFKDGKLIQSQVGLQPRNILEEWIKKVL